MEKKDILFKEIDLIQNCINKASQSSFVVKGWLITLIAVVLALFSENVRWQNICLIVFASSLCFWYLDAFFLKVDKLYRWKYEWVINNRMLTDEYRFDLNPYNINMLGNDESGAARKIPHTICVMFSKTLLVFYAPLLVVSLAYLIYVK